MRGYQPAWFRLDLVAGLAAGHRGDPAGHGLRHDRRAAGGGRVYTCMVPMVAYALLGGSRTLSVSTTSTIAVLAAATLAALPASADELLRDAFTLTILVGLCLLVMRLFRLGSLVENISPATMTGVKTGVGLTVAVGQLPHLLGVHRPGRRRILRQARRHARRSSPTPNADRRGLGAAHRPPAPPAAAVRTPGARVRWSRSPAASSGGADRRGGARARADRPVPTGLPTPSLPVFGDVFALLPGALAIAVMAFLETVLVARTNRQRAEPPIDSDQELLANGVASMAGGLSQSLPPAGGFSQSAVNLRAGARSQLADLTAVLAVLVALFLGPAARRPPQAVLAAMVMVAVLGLLHPARVRPLRAHRPRRVLGRALVTGLGLTGGLLLARRRRRRAHPGAGDPSGLNRRKCARSTPRTGAAGRRPGPSDAGVTIHDRCCCCISRARSTPVTHRRR